MIQFTITGQFEENDALEVAKARGYSEILTIPDPNDATLSINIPNPVTPEQHVINYMKQLCANDLADVYRQRAYKAKEALFNQEIAAQNAAILTTIESAITTNAVVL